MDKEIVFYRDHPKDPDNRMQIGRFYKYNRNTKRQLVGEFETDRRKIVWSPRRRESFWGWRKACSENITFIPIGDKRIIFRDVVKQYRSFYQLTLKTNGFLDPTQGSINNMLVAALMNSMSKNVRSHLHDADCEVQHVVKQAFMGGIMYAEKDWQGQAWKYDITSCYPSIMNSANKFPLGKPVFRRLDAIEVSDLERPAFYLAEISGQHPLMRNTQSGRPLGFKWYTNVDINIALQLDLDVFLDGEHEFNCLRFTHSVPGRAIFGKYVTTLFPYKRDASDEESRTGAKLALNKLFGLLAKKKWKTYGKGGDNSLDRFQDADEVVTGIVPDDDGGDVITCINPQKLYARPNLCVFAPFVSAYARHRLVNLINPEHVKHIHTDGWILSQPATYDCEGSSSDLGGIKLEKQGWAHVVHAMKVLDSEGNKF